LQQLGVENTDTETMYYLAKQYEIGTGRQTSFFSAKYNKVIWLALW
jgi:hypothetical protein